jgi:SAM-dependent methyltransferase
VVASGDGDATALEPLLAEQIAYYRALAPAYELGALTDEGAEELEAALDAFGPSGDVLELACGTGMWTAQLARHAASLTAVDASPEMLARARSRVGESAVRFIHSNIFEWRPARRYDTVVFGFWLSHVPLERQRASHRQGGPRAGAARSTARGAGLERSRARDLGAVLLGRGSACVRAAATSVSAYSGR